MTRRVFIDRRLRFLIVCLFALAVGMMIEAFMLTYYLAPFYCGVLPRLVCKLMRHLRQWKVREQPVRGCMLRFMLTIVFVVRAAIQTVGGLAAPDAILALPQGGLELRFCRSEAIVGHGPSWH